MKYQIKVTTTYKGNEPWLDDYLVQLAKHYGDDFAKKLEREHRAEFRSTDDDGSMAISVYELNQTGV